MNQTIVALLPSLQEHARSAGYRIITAALAYAALVTAAQAQTAAQRISHAPACGECRIEVKKVLTIGSPNDEVLAGNVAPLVRNGRGQFFAIAHDRFQFIVYDGAGKYVSAIGRRGQGPGEFSAQLGISLLAVDRHDSLFVVTQGRVTVYTPQLQFTRTFDIPSGLITSFRALADGTLLVGGTFRTPGNLGYAYHIMNRSGQIVRSFGDGRLSALGSNSPAGRIDAPPRHFAIQPDEKAIWISPGYHVREIRLDGAPGLEVDVTNVPWLQASKRDTTIAGRGGRPVVMQVGGGSVDPAGYTADGLLWISGGMPPAGGREGTWSYGIDVFDPTTRRILASTATPKWLTFMADGYASSLEVDDDGVMTFSLWQVQFHDARKSR